MLLQWILSRFKGADAVAAALEQVQMLRMRGEFEAARQGCLEILRDEPRDARVMALLAAIAADQHQAENGMQWVRQALAVNPASVATNFAWGRLLEGAERYEEAEAVYRKVTQLDARHAKAQTNLGCMLHLQGRIDEAAACYRQALRLEPGQPEALRNYALIVGGLQELQDAAAGFETYLATHPKDASAHHQLAHLHLRLGRYAQALAGYEHAITLEPDQAEYHFARAQLLLMLERYEEGWQEYEWRWRLATFNAPMRRFTQPRWGGGRLEHGTLLVHGETGFGDMFQLVRYVALAAERCARVVVECQPALKALIADVPGVFQVVAQGDPLPAFDAHMPLISFPGVFGTTIDTIPWRGPYIQADAQKEQDWAARVAASGARGRRIGLVWTGNPQNAGNRERSVTLQQLGLLAQTVQASFFSLQKGGEAVQAGNVPPGMHFLDLTGQIRDFSDTSALLTQLDLVITVDTSVAHLAGAMGRPTWVLLPFSADWRYHVGRTDNPWYPSMHLFRQERDGDWSQPLEQLKLALEAWV